MNLSEIYNKLSQRTNSMSFNPPATEIYISAFENDNSVQLPKPYRELLKLFNGGEIYTPGTIIYGIDSEDENSFKYINKANKPALKIHENYYIIAKLNYGDYICLNFLPPYDVIQWDNTNKRKYLSWTSLELWLESIIDFGYIPKEEKIINTPIFPNNTSNSSTAPPKRRMFLPIILSIVPVIVICGFIAYGKVKNTTEQNEVEFDQVGYVSKLYVVLENETRLEVAVTGVVITKDDPLNVREQPNANSKILGTVPKGGTVSIISDDGEWYEIKYGSGKGYVSKKYVSLS